MNDTMNGMKKSNLLSVEEALGLLLEQAKPLNDIELVATESALWRVLAAPQISTVDVPPLDNSAMDGYAVRMTDLSTSTRLRVTQRIPAGCVGHILEAGTAARIFTGAPVPPHCDAVVMQENCTAENGEIIVNKAPKAGENIRRAGEDIQSGAELLAAGIKLRPQEMGLLASVGLAHLPVYRKLRVATFFTGDEIIMPGQALQPGQIYNSNRFVLTGLLKSLGCEVVDLGIVPDDLTTTIEILRQAAACSDLIVTSGGVSVGEEDHVKAAVEHSGKLDLWRIAIKPGKPLAFGSAAGTAFIGLPGNPVSAFVTFCLFVRPFILRRQGIVNVVSTHYPLHADFDWNKPDSKRREFLRARMAFSEDGSPVAQIYPFQGSGVLTSCTWSDGLIEVAEGMTVQRGETVKFTPFTELF